MSFYIAWNEAILKILGKKWVWVPFLPRFSWKGQAKLIFEEKLFVHFLRYLNIQFQKKNWQIDCCLLLSSSSLDAEHADFSFHACAAQKTLSGLNTSLITKKSHVSGQRFDGLTRDEEKYLLNVRDYEIKSLESFLNLAHPCQLAELFWPGWCWRSHRHVQCGIFSCATTTTTTKWSSSKEISIQPRCSKTFRQICLQHFSSILKTQPSRKGACNYYNEIWGKEDGMDDGSCVFNWLMCLICLSQHQQAYYHFFSCLSFCICS